MTTDERTLDFLDIPSDGSFVALGQTLKCNNVYGAMLFDLHPSDGEEPTPLLLHILSTNGGGLLSHIEHKAGDPFFTVIRLDSPLYITVIPEAWLRDALKLPAFLDAFTNHPYLKNILDVQNFFLNIKSKAKEDIILSFYQDKLQQFKGCFFDSFADFFLNDYFSNMVMFAITEMAYNKTLIQNYGLDEVFLRIMDATPAHLLSLPADRLKKSFYSIATMHGSKES